MFGEGGLPAPILSNYSPEFVLTSSCQSYCFAIYSEITVVILGVGRSVFTGANNQIAGWFSNSMAYHIFPQTCKPQGENASWIFITIYKFKRDKKFLRDPLHCKVFGVPKSWKLLASPPVLHKVIPRHLA